MRILALESYYGGSHQAFLDGWIAQSRHEWTLLTLPAYKWKWRMRHSAMTFAAQLDALPADKPYDLLFCTDMVNLAELVGLLRGPTRDLPRVLYFHENQLTYPVRFEQERDYHFVLTNLTSALAADAVWFNSDYHRATLLAALPDFLRRMPDQQPLDSVDQVAAKATVAWPGIDGPGDSAVDRDAGPLRIAWAARWEHDKAPDTFFAALRRFRRDGGTARLSVLGEHFRDSPAVFEQAREEFADWIDDWGYLERRADYWRTLQRADVFVSTARHEFFGLSAAEAIAAGCLPLLPDRLAYPEVLSLCGPGAPDLYDGSEADLARRLLDLAREPAAAREGSSARSAALLDTLAWPARATVLDADLERLRSLRQH